MKKTIINSLFLFFTGLTFAQTNDANIKQIQNYIQTTSQTEWFDPINVKGTLSGGNSYDLAYYMLPTQEPFSIIYTVFSKTTIRKVFYYENKELVACIIEETDANNANKLLRYADYFYKEGVLINTADEKKEFPSTEIYQEGIQKRNETPKTNI